MAICARGVELHMKRCSNRSDPSRLERSTVPFTVEEHLANVQRSAAANDPFFCLLPLCNTSQRDIRAHQGRLCGHNAIYGPETKHCMCNPAYSCAGKHCSRAHAVAGGTDRSGFDPQRCRRCACVSADAATQAGRGSAVAGTGVATDTAMPTYSPSARAVMVPQNGQFSVPGSVLTAG